jgi:hypothetical protein
MNVFQLSEAVRFLDDLLFWVQCPDPNGQTTQDSWRNAMLERMEELLVDHVDYRSISPRIRNLIHTLNGNPFPDFLKVPFVEVQGIRDDLRNELHQVDRPKSTPNPVPVQEQEIITKPQLKVLLKKFGLADAVDNWNNKEDGFPLTLDPKAKPKPYLRSEVAAWLLRKKQITLPANSP